MHFLPTKYRSKRIKFRFCFVSTAFFLWFYCRSLYYSTENSTLVIIIQYSSNAYRDHGGKGFLALQTSPQNQLNTYFMTSSKCITKLNNIFRSFLTNSEKFMRILKFFYVVEFSTDWLNDWHTSLLMPSDKRNLIRAMAKGLISSLFQSHFVPRFAFSPTTTAPVLASWYYWIYLCSLLCSSPFSVTTLVMICATYIMALVWDYGICRASRGASYVILCLEHCPTCSKS